MSRFICFIGVLLLSGVVAGSERPNIILILADDMGYSDIGCYGGEIETPNIDRLAEEGMRFRNFYNNSKCTTTRASLMSGRYPNRGKGGLLPQDCLTLPEAMKMAGYRTILSGKWHLGHRKGSLPIDRGFDESYGLFDGCSSFFYPTDPDKPNFGMRYFGHNEKRIIEFPDHFYATDAFTDHALEEIKKSIEAQQPYFLHLAYTAPHYPLHALPEDIAKYKGRYSKGWKVLREERYQRMIELGVIDSLVQLSPLDPKTEIWTGDAHYQRLMEIHAAMVDRMDQQIGRVLKLLDETGTAENTLIFFLSDNGASREWHNYDCVEQAEIGARGSYRSIGLNWANAANTPFRKFKLYGHEGGMCTPCVVRWPVTVPAGSWTDAVGHIIDFQPTFMTVAGLDPVEDIPVEKKPLDGETLVSVLQGEERNRDKPVFMEFAGNRAMLDGNWKIAYAKELKRWELFNLSEDRTELNDLSEAYPERLLHMSTQWNAWARNSGIKYKIKGNE
ncbi:arylsulfatase [Pontiella agarivorans]|uniref:Arylsulfatase n=1 Tax=Pontiella agarivorans TaxID=3038953 RepID=A0ABU5MU34_9BACT|nr:arylsulfatase [Pontiella agarivorans]MDZ8117476.1 arylsulfatase [Pontiella agarivorans]